MPDPNLVSTHYANTSLLSVIEQGLAKLGKTTEQVDVDDLGPVDEFHIGGRIATENFLDQLQISPSHSVLDVGCGLGGSSRFAASKYGCSVTGVDLTTDYVETGNTLCNWVGLGDKIQLQVGDATDLPQFDGLFDCAFMLHVGMNIADKEGLARQLFRAVRPGGKVGIYDVMQVRAGDLAFPVPWATTPEGSSVAPADRYESALSEAGFVIKSKRNRRDFALEFFEQLRARTAGADGPPPLGLHILMGPSAPEKVSNMIENVSRNLVAPIEFIAEKPALAH